MTHLALPEQWSFSGVDLSTYAYLVAKVAGVDEFPPLRGEDVAVPGLPGRVPLGKMFDATRVSLMVYVSPVDASGALVAPTNPRQTRINLDALYAVLSRRATGPLVRTMPDGSTRTATAEVVGVSGIEDRYAHELVGLTVDFALADPFFYGAAIVDGPRAISASPTTFSITNTGTVASRKPLLDFLGPISNPRLANLTIDPAGGFYVEVLVTVAATKHLLVDVGRFTAKNDGAEAIGSVRHSGAKEFFRLEPGPNSLRVTATTPGGSLSTTFSPPFV